MGLETLNCLLGYRLSSLRGSAPPSCWFCLKEYTTRPSTPSRSTSEKLTNSGPRGPRSDKPWVWHVSPPGSGSLGRSDAEHLIWALPDLPIADYEWLCGEADHVVLRPRDGRLGSVQSEVALDALKALTEFVDVGPEGPRLVELPARARRGERLVDDDGEGDDALRAVHTGHHLGGDAPAAVPRTQRGPGDARGVDRLLQRDPALFDAMAGQVAEKAIPAVPGIRFALARHRAITTVPQAACTTVLSDRGLTWFVC